MKPRKEPFWGATDAQRVDSRDWQEPNFGYSVETIYGLEAFLALKDQWVDLAQQDPSVSPYITWNWIKGWIEVWGAGRDFVTLVCRQHDQVVGIVPFFWKTKPSPLEVRKLWMVGFSDGAGGNGLTEEPLFVMEPNRILRENIWKAVHRKLESMLIDGGWDAAAYRRFGMGIEGCSLVEVRQLTINVQEFHRGCEVVSLPDTWEKYLKTISKSMRENIPYYPKKFVKEGLSYIVETVALSEVEETLDALIALHKKRTYLDPTMQHMDYFAEPRQQHLFKLSVSRMVENGEAHVVVLRVEGKIVAAQVFLQNQHTLLAHYSGFDPDWSKYSPLFVLQTEVIRQAIAKGFTTMNLLRGNAEWQKRWGAQPAEPIVDITLAKRLPVARIRQVLQDHEGQLVKRFGKAKAIRKFRASYELRQIRSA